MSRPLSWPPHCPPTAVYLPHLAHFFLSFWNIPQEKPPAHIVLLVRWKTASKVSPLRVLSLSSIAGRGNQPPATVPRTEQNRIFREFSFIPREQPSFSPLRSCLTANQGPVCSLTFLSTYQYPNPPPLFTSHRRPPYTTHLSP